MKQTSMYTGVSRHCKTGRYEAHLWDCNHVGHGKGRSRGRQVYLGGFLTEAEAAHAVDRAMIVFRGVDAALNFKLKEYEQELGELGKMTQDEVVRSIRRESMLSRRGMTALRGVYANKKTGKWEARISAGKTQGGVKYLGLFVSKSEAAAAYDAAAWDMHGDAALTNFPLERPTPGVHGEFDKTDALLIDLMLQRVERRVAFSDLDDAESVSSLFTQ